MATVTLQASSPILIGGELIEVVVKDSDGLTVFTGSQTNDPFDVAGLVDGDYTAYFTYGTNTKNYCFTISPCVCPTLLDFDIVARETSPVLYDYVLTFDFSTFQPTRECSFCLDLAWPDGSGAHLCFSDIATFTDLGSDIYEWKYFAGSDQTSVTYRISKSTQPDYISGEVCVPDTSVSYECGLFSLGFPTLEIIYPTDPSDDYSVQVTYPSCGDVCQSVSWNWVETDSPSIRGTFTDTLVCSPSSLTFNHILGKNPAPGFPLRYRFVGTDCCGNTYTKDLVYCKSVLQRSYLTNSVVPFTQTIRVTVNSCDVAHLCGNIYTISWHQVNAVGVPDSGTMVVTLNCGSLPNIFNISTTPAPIPPTDTFALYHIQVTGCCFNNGYGPFAITP